MQNIKTAVHVKNLCISKSHSTQYGNVAAFCTFGFTYSAFLAFSTDAFFVPHFQSPRSTCYPHRLFLCPTRDFTPRSSRCFGRRPKQKCHNERTTSFLPARRCASEVFAIALCPFVRLSVTRPPILFGNGWTDRARFGTEDPYIVLEGNSGMYLQK